jgi:hypothetical protein
MIQWPDDPEKKASGSTDRRAGRLVFLGLHRCDLVGRTGFEPVTSSVVREFWTVWHRRTESSGEPLTWAHILSGSG